jgi:hypothetical protein
MNEPNIPRRMTAVEITRPGGPEVLVPALRPTPVPLPREVLICVFAAGVNGPDVLQRKGLYQPPAGASDIPGLEISGVVVALGSETSRFAVGDKVDAFVLQLADAKGLLKGKTLAVDATTLEANAAMKSIVRRDTGADWRQYVMQLMREEGTIAPEDEPSDEELRRYDKKRKKKVSNDDWVSVTDPDARITKMKDGRTHLAYKAEHVVDLESEILLAAEIRPADEADTQTLVDSVMEAQINLEAAGSDIEIEEVAADKGYHANATLERPPTWACGHIFPSRSRKIAACGPTSRPSSSGRWSTTAAAWPA